MNSRELFKIYFSKQLTNNKGILFLVTLSLIISFSISIFVPIISHNHKAKIINNIDKINGGDIKIEGNIVLEDIEDEVFKIDDTAEIQKNYVRSSTIKSRNDNKFIFDLLIGDYNLAENEIILAEKLADQYGYAVGDEIEILVNSNYERFIINVIDSVDTGVPGQSEFIGYGKISEKYLLETVGEPRLITINSKSADVIEEKLADKFPNLKIKTIEDTRKEQESSIEMQNVSMNLLNVMGYILMMSVLAGTIMMFLIKYRRDISILKLLFIKNKVIKKGLFIEFFSVGMVSLVLSLPISYIAQQIISNSLGIQNIGTNSEIIKLMIRGFVINFAVLIIIVKMLSSTVGTISPLSLLNKDYSGLYKKLKRMGLVLLPLVLVSIFAYGIFSGQSAIFKGFMVIIVLIAMLLLILSIAFFIITKIPTRIEVLNYTSKTFRNEKGINILLILNTTLLLIFFIIGFKFPDLFKLTYDQELEQELPYNYMIVSKDLDSVAVEIEEKLDKDESFTLVSQENGLMVFEDEFVDIVETGIDVEYYNNKFKIIEGKNLIETDKDGILISKDLKSQEGLKVNDEIQIATEENLTEYYVRGIYENGTINSNWILRSETDRENSMILLKADKDIAKIELSDASIASLALVGEMMLSKADGFLKGFRYICIIFSGSALLFNVLLMISNSSMKKREFTIIRALSKGESFIKKSVIINFIYSLILSSICALAVYWIVGQFIFKILLDLEMVLDNRIFIMTILLATIFNFITYFQLFFKTNKFVDYKLLRSD